MKCYTSGCRWHSSPDAGSIEAFNEGLGPRKGTQGQMVAHLYISLLRKAADSFFGFRTSATMHKVFLEGNKCSLCDVEKIVRFANFYVTVTHISHISVYTFPIPLPPSIIYGLTVIIYQSLILCVENGVL